ncbi:MAG: MATE family efflux transporter, partial [Clostridia bacterium]|nr:MATE family efflux transporter [Clostridia bacterium]
MRRRIRSNYEIDMCNGPLFSKVLQFSLPLMATGILQLLYNAADIIVVGRFAGKTALAAVSSTSSLINLIVNLFMGLSVGASVVVAKRYGAGDYAGVNRVLHTAVTLSIISGLLVSVVGITLSRTLLEMMGSPVDVIDQAALYLKIYFIGIPAAMIYNYCAASLRAIGDTKRPLYYLSISGLVNVLLNLLLVICFDMGVAGVAIATAVSQVVSMVLIVICLIRTDGCIHLNLKKLHIDVQQMKDILKIGLPAGLQSSVFSISNVLIQSSINS